MSLQIFNNKPVFNGRPEKSICNYCVFERHLACIVQTEISNNFLKSNGNCEIRFSRGIIDSFNCPKPTSILPLKGETKKF